MIQTEPDVASRLESRSLGLSMGGNAFMGLAGILAGILANSSAIMLDGLFSMIGFVAAFLGQRISRRIDAGPDRLRPLGYAADEALFSTFRALSLLGVVMFASIVALKNIYNFSIGIVPPPLQFEPMMIYFVGIGVICFLLWAVHRYAWSKTGKASEILRLEAKAAFFDGIITVAAGVGMAAIYVFQDGFLAPVVPIGDSVILLVLCAAATGTYLRDFRAGIAELAGVTASPEAVAAARRAVRAALSADGGALQDVAVQKIGRQYQITVYYDPGRAVSASDMDQLNLRLIDDVRQSLPRADVILAMSEYGRRWPEEFCVYQGTENEA